MQLNYQSQNRLLTNGDFSDIAGVDEAGRGALAGPVVAAAVILPIESQIVYRDSKSISASRRFELMGHLVKSGAKIGVGIVSNAGIDRTNILISTLAAMQIAVRSLPITPAAVVVDGNRCPVLPVPVTAIVSGDKTVSTISAASIVAKVVRDAIMAGYDRVFPGYQFAIHKGYGTALHYTAISEFGPSSIHRRSFTLYQPMQLFDTTSAAGSAGEARVAQLLVQAGYRIIDTNVRIGKIEIDILVEAPDATIVLVEVKTFKRDAMYHPLQAITPAKRRLLTTGLKLLMARDQWRGRQFRLDVIAIQGQLVEHLENIPLLTK